MQVIRVGVVGVGHLGQHHARNYSEMEGCQLVGVADIDHKAATRVASAHRCQAFFDFRQLIGQVDAVSVVVPTVQHYDVARAFLEAGIHVLVEKPITSTIVEARALIDIARRRNLILQVGHIERFNAAIIKLQEVLTRPGFIESHRLGPYDPRVRDVGVVLDLMIHDIDIILQIVRSPIVSIDAVGVPILSPREDIANARIKFQNGCTANLTVSRVTPNRMRKIRIFQPNTYVSVDYMKQAMEIYQTVEIKDAREGEPQAQIVRKRLRLKKEEPLRRELVHFVSCVREGSQPAVTGEHGQNALEVAIRVVEQIQQRQALESLSEHEPAS
ncbi:MAG: putative oxidoreductase YceM [candidate division BRC1 bacterium ADurb.BinA292]|nr:MAG: putative oxidoreductase YceM [candidate division BRC1 bacterium ADurb.BinA292]